MMPYFYTGLIFGCCLIDYSPLAIAFVLGIDAMMYRITFFILLCLSSSFTVAQEAPLEPKYDLSPSIAKLPARSDFYGAWLRSDGTYRVEIEPGVGAGAVVARYFNPDPINVEAASFDEVGGQPRIEFILRDEGYPGSAYQLVFLAERRVLVGSYARPGSEPAEVYFVKQGE
jgi:hypothetical protein